MLLSLVCCGAEDLFSLSSDLNTTLSINWSPSQLLVDCIVMCWDCTVVHSLSKLIGLKKDLDYRKILLNEAHSFNTEPCSITPIECTLSQNTLIEQSFLLFG